MNQDALVELESSRLPILPLRDVVVFPHMVVPLFVGREKSIAALQAAMDAEKRIVLLAQKKPSEDEPGEQDLYTVGTLVNVLQMLRLPDGTVKVLVEGEHRVEILEPDLSGDYFSCSIKVNAPQAIEERDQQALMRTLNEHFDRYVQLSKKVPTEVLSSLEHISTAGRLVDTIAAHLSLKLDDKQKVLEITDLEQRIEHVLSLVDAEVDLLQVEKRIRGRVKKQMEKSQREYYLNEQMKAIQKELNDIDGNGNELGLLEDKVKEAKMSPEAEEKTLTELNKLKMMSSMSAEASVVRGYVDWMLALPWNKRSRVKSDLQLAHDTLEEDHYGLEEVKERILEYLAVQKRMKKLKGPVLCLVGPPGVGKTSLARSIARSTNRKFVRMALGGVRDESEIRGHRRTYIGSMPGKILQKLSKADVKNPLFLLDEIDKMGMDHRGDPASALLEVLDPEQNNTFNDHYIEVDYDLSDVMFVCTSNSMNIPGPLLDRMEVIRIPGYTEDEKLNIAKKYLAPKQIKENGLKKGEIEITDEAIMMLIRQYTREAGVRGLERELAKICRKVVKQNVLLKSPELTVVTAANLETFSGVYKFRYGLAEKEDQVGQVTGLAWTSVGGELLTLEATVMPGKGRMVRTGKLGDVMQESIQAALTVVRSRAQSLGLFASIFDKTDMHIHVPEGATPKDGPSAGIGMATALVSSLTKIPVRADVAMTGEITLRGQVLAIGGLKEKLLAAHRGGIKRVIIPEENRKDLKEIPESVLKDLEVIPVNWIDEVLRESLLTFPKALSDQEFEADLQSANGEKAKESASRPSTH